MDSTCINVASLKGVKAEAEAGPRDIMLVFSLVNLGVALIDWRL